jgi:hypothetical protein
MRWTGELGKGGGNTAGFVIPEEVVDALGGGRRPKVRVTVEGYSWRSSIASMGGQFMLGVSQAHRAASGLTPGRTYDVDLELDTALRTVDLPDDLGRAIDAQPGAREHWERLSFTHQREHVEAVEGAKRAETRERRIERCLAMLAAKG